MLPFTKLPEIGSTEGAVFWGEPKFVVKNSYSTQTSKPDLVGIQLYADFDKVALSDQYLVSFPSPNKDDFTVWHRTYTLSKTVFSFRSGSLKVYKLFRHHNNRKWQIRDVTAGFILRSGGDYVLLARCLQRMAWDHGIEVPPLEHFCGEDITGQMTGAGRFGPLALQRLVHWIAFPVTRHFNFSVPQGVIKASEPKHWRKAETLRDLVEGIFGTYTKTHLKTLLAVCDKNQWPLMWEENLASSLSALRFLKGVVPHEWLTTDVIMGLSTLADTMQSPEMVKTIRKITRTVTPKKALEFFQLNPFHQADIVRMLIATPDYEIPHRQFTWPEVHDAVMLMGRFAQVADVPIMRGKVAKIIDGMVMNSGLIDNYNTDFTIVLPETTHDLLRWGSEMDHCIGAYANVAATDSSEVFFAVMQGDKMVANGWLKGTGPTAVRFNQLFGKHNQSLSREMFDMIWDYLNEDLLFSQDRKNVWGYPGVALPMFA